MSTHTTTTIWKRGVRYPAGTPIEQLPDNVRAGLTALHVDNPAGLHSADPETPDTPPAKKRGRPRKVLAEPAADVLDDPLAEEPF